MHFVLGFSDLLPDHQIEAKEVAMDWNLFLRCLTMEFAELDPSTLRSLKFLLAVMIIFLMWGFSEIIIVTWEKGRKHES